MTTILRERVACLFYAVEYTVENTKKYTKLIDEIEAVEICYTGNPKKPPPRLLCTRVINANSLDIHLYQPEPDQQEPLKPSNQRVKLRT